MSYDLKITPEEARAAITVLQAYVQERLALVKLDEDGRCKITDSIDAIRFMDAIYQFKEELQDRVKTPVEKVYEVVRFAVIPSLMDAAGVTTMTVSGVGRVNLQDDVQCQVKNQALLHGWLIDREFEDMIKQTVNAQTLAAFVRRRLKAGDDLPSEEVLGVKPLTRAVITRGGNRGKDAAPAD